MNEEAPPAPSVQAAAPKPIKDRRTQAREFEAAQPGWQRMLNGFCENWIFAFIIAMALRHFFLEAYRIPTASMEPALYGDVALTKADHVVVDKMLFRFTGPSRWGVTVFQYPVPEVQGARGGEVLAIQPDGSRLDSFPFRPLLQRNFVKRCVGMPGDVFYIANGDFYVQQADGSFAVQAKPEHIQQALWLPVYRHGEADGYLPWSNGGSAVASQVSSEGGALVFTVDETDAGVLFTQPLRNFFVKPGAVNVRPRSGNGDWQQVEVSLLQPLFTYQGRDGNIYDERNWQVNRLTTADLDANRYGSALHPRMNEWVGDVRLSLRPQRVQGAVEVLIAQGASNRLRLQLSEGGWQLWLAEEVLASGDQSPVGRLLQLALVDNHARMWLDGEPVMAARPTIAVDSQEVSSRTQIQVRGSGVLTCAELAIDRDIHYTHDGIMLSDAADWQTRLPATAGPQERALFDRLQSDILLKRRRFIPFLADASLREAMLASMERRDQGRDNLWLQPVGVSPETALQIPEGGYLLLGDNSPFSLDSRTWGWVPVTNMRGTVLGVIFPFSRWQRVR